MIKRLLINLVLYSAIVLGLLHLYYPFNKDPQNQPGSAVQFVYQQF
jgi:hypothetical protein